MNPLKNYKMKDNRQIQKAAVIGSGIMGSRIACHLANVGIQVLLLDITPLKLNESEEKQGFDLDQDIVKIGL
jgi:3-hydroxyacyl-CoA dehydrogenase